MNKLKVEYVNIDTIQMSSKNAKLHPQEQIDQIKLSIQRNEFNDPIAVRNGVIIEGHGRYLACKELGIKEVPIIRLDYLTEEQANEYMLVHNQLTLNSGYDLEKLEYALDEIDYDMTNYGFEIPEDDDEIEIEEVDTPEPPKEPKSKLGDIYQLGNHRLMCGDSTSKEDIEQLMNQELADMVFTDPPYNVNVESRSKKGIDKILNDNLDETEFENFINQVFAYIYI